MIKDSITYAAEILQVGTVKLPQPHPIDEAFWVGDVVVLLYSPDSEHSKFGQFPNLIAVDPETGKQIWQAELPTTTTGDRYYNVATYEPLVVRSVKSFVCTIDPETGRIIDKQFVK
jgi:outer membrane protein assembly factor BamB